MKRHPILLVILLAGGRLAAAQAPADAPTAWVPRRWAVGTALPYYPRFALAEARDGQGGTEYVRHWPVLPTLTYHTKRQGSIEIGLLLRTERPRTTTTASNSGTYTNRRRATSWAVPVMGRTPLSMFRAGRGQLDFVLGIMPLAANYEEETTFTDARSGQTQVQGSFRNSYSDFLFVGGLGGTYALTPNLRLTADARVTASVLLAVVGAALSNNGIKNDISPFAPALSTGVSYQFGKTR